MREWRYLKREHHKERQKYLIDGEIVISSDALVVLNGIKNNIPVKQIAAEMGVESRTAVYKVARQILDDNLGVAGDPPTLNKIIDILDQKELVNLEMAEYFKDKI